MGKSETTNSQSTIFNMKSNERKRARQLLKRLKDGKLGNNSCTLKKEKFCLKRTFMAFSFCPGNFHLFDFSTRWNTFMKNIGGDFSANEPRGCNRLRSCLQKLVSSSTYFESTQRISDRKVSDKVINESGCSH